MDSQPHEQAGLRDYLAILRRRKWIALEALVLVPAAAIAFSLHQTAKYQASAEVLLSRQDLAASLSNINNPAFSVDPVRLVQTQADLAAVPIVAERTIRATHAKITLDQFEASSSVSGKTDADLLVFHYTARSRAVAARLATEYANQYIAYRKELDTQALTRARAQVQARLGKLEAEGDRSSALYTSLVDRDQQLATMQALQTANATLVKAARGASQTQPKTVRNGILGVVLGLVLGLGLAFLREALETRIRSGDEVSRRLRLPLLGRIPAPPRTLAKSDRLVMVDGPRGPRAEPFRVLRTNLEFLALEKRTRSVLVTSASEEEGKSTTAANLAVALALAGRHVVLVDLDLRRPYLERFFGLQDRVGLTEVALGRAPLEAALSPVELAGATTLVSPAAAGQNGSGEPGLLEVLTAGPVPPNPGEFVGTPAVAETLEELARRAEFVIVDSPPLLSVGDALAMSSAVDGLLLVTRLNRVRKQMLSELQRMLARLPVDVLGFVVTEAEADERYGYGYGYYYGQPESARLPGDELEPLPERFA